MKNLGIGLIVGATLASSVGSTFKSLDKSIGQLQAKARDVKLGISAGERWKDLHGESLKLSSALQAGKLDAAGIARFHQLKAATKEAEAEAREYGFTLGGLNKQLGTMQRFSAVQDGFLRRAEARDARKQERGELRSQLAGTMAIGTAMLAYPLKAAMDFEQGIAEVGAITRANDADMVRLTENAREMGRTTKFSATQAAQGQKFLAMAGFKTDQIIDSMPGMLDLAAAANMDLGRTADITSNILTGFGMDATQMTRVANVMALAFSSSNTNVEQLGYAMKYAAPQAKALGFSIEQTAAIVSKLSDAGIQGEMAGTTLRGMIDSLTDPTKEAEMFLNDMGIRRKDAKGNLRALPDIIRDLDAAMTKRGFGRADKARGVKTVFGARAGTGANAIWDSVLDGSLEELTQKYINEQDGAVQRMADKMNATAKGSLTQLGSALESVGIDLGNVLLPPLAETAKGLASIVGSVSQFMQKCPVLTKWVVGLGAGFVGLKAATLATRIGWSHLRDGGSIALDILQRVRPSVIANSLAMARMRGEGSALKGMFTVLKGGIGSFVSGAVADFNVLWSGMGTAFSALQSVSAAVFTPLTMSVMALAGAVYLVWRNWDDFSGAWKEGWEQIKKAWEECRIGDLVMSGLATPLTSIMVLIRDVTQGLSNLFGMTGDSTALDNAVGAAQERLASGNYNPGDEYVAMAGISGHASGGLINRPVVSWVGEDGPEVVVPVGSQHRQQGLFWLGKAASALDMTLAPKETGGGSLSTAASGPIQGAPKTLASLPPLTPASQPTVSAGGGFLGKAAPTLGMTLAPQETGGGSLSTAASGPIQGAPKTLASLPLLAPASQPTISAGGGFLGKAASALDMTFSEKGAAVPSSGASPSWMDRVREFSASVMAAPRPALAGAGGFQMGDIHVHAAPGMNESALADLVVRKIEDVQRCQQIRQRGSYHDDAFLG